MTPEELTQKRKDANAILRARLMKIVAQGEK
jgi:hypothetical protein